MRCICSSSNIFATSVALCICVICSFFSCLVASPNFKSSFTSASAAVRLSSSLSGCSDCQSAIGTVGKFSVLSRNRGVASVCFQLPSLFATEARGKKQSLRPGVGAASLSFSSSCPSFKLGPHSHFPSCRHLRAGSVSLKSAASSSMSSTAVSPSPSSPSPADISIPLTEEEARLFDLLKSALRECGLKTTMRVAGGWVRDKILGKTSPDIDIALDDMTGKDFAEKVTEWMKTKGMETHSVGVIRSNPDQSKHLETATTSIAGLKIDFLNLRTESYAEHTRIPTAEIGTPEEDAKRRDFTFNALFYNINTATVEDFTGHGLTDLRRGVVRTPLDARTTFLDDPLRVLRAVRFASRYRFELTEDVRDNCRCKEVHEALANKVSRERIGVEMEGIMKKSDLVFAFGMIRDLSLCDVIFPLPEGLEGEGGSVERSYDLGIAHVRSYLWLERRLRSAAQSAALGEKQRQGADLLLRAFEEQEGDHKRIGAYAAFLIPFAGLEYKTKKQRLEPAVQHVMLEGLKLPKRDADRIVLLHKSSNAFRDLLPLPETLLTEGGAISEDSSSPARASDDAASSSGASLSLSRVQAGEVLRQAGELWKMACILALCRHVTPALGSLPPPHLTTEPEPLEIPPTNGNGNGVGGVEGGAVGSVGGVQREESTGGGEGTSVASSILRHFCVGAEEIRALGLEGVWDLKPLLDGGELKKSVLPNLPKGPEFKIVLDEEMRWMLGHPEGTKEQCASHLRETFEKFR
uniref:Poly A polymerase head domain-containing protein n=1 Tax=Chromera velia CCMP2878 TaxID=1169474 RepID=A0A0K6S886_9ALVE|mmetsp:Transcript_24187/g.47569  ORF Transcript_24187/g.47569 Transcript_24187/m.47569 type:complete len:749 (+) Transcript_24187:188-2434(+)|eukprot:Cvel_23819.t1-p1 / transcript=Cvel_23819.t1 / gene=Cvel_23819 / organism=Chromera_velia_CCMP2878 / gene_product=CCA tRNA nucleotidyltransferase, mitochondrial, putative / transcript_product=CCA tRNA nucleotidyltransferase, mitochondrial, putative / location=Cvel_scaffold2502:7602-14971(+) / protein_length=748 / sequence_SO=supercontig / SO=protein_coding / is_pseudo=false